MINLKHLQIVATLDTSKLKTEYRQYLPLMTGLLMESAIKKDGKVIPYEQVIKDRNADLLSFSVAMSLGSYGYFSCGGYCHVVKVEFEVKIRIYFLYFFLFLNYSPNK